MFPEFAALIFMSSEYAHRAHLYYNKESGHAVHVTLAEFYPALIDLRDKLVQTYQGRVRQVVELGVAEMTSVTEFHPKDALRQHLEIIEGTRYQAVDPKDSPIQNIIDEICGLYLNTLYQLDQLK